MRNRSDRTGEKILEEKNIKETFKHNNFIKYARKTTKFLIASSRGNGKVDGVTKGNRCNFLGVPTDGMGK